MDDLDDEFRFLANDAARVGRGADLPDVRRASVPVADGRRVSALRWQPELAPEYVLLHGAGLNAHSWDPTVLKLDSPALSIDLPGHGRSDWREDGDYRAEVIAPDVATVVEELAPAPITLVGQSLGGLTAALVAAERPGAIRRLVVVDITPGVVPQRSAQSITEFITGQRDYATHEEIVDRAIAFGIGRNREALARGVALNTRRRPDGRWEWTHHLAHLDRLPGRSDEALPFAHVWSALEALHAAGVPLALVAASAGIVGAEHCEEWADRLPGSEIVTVEGPHNLHEASPVELARVIAETA